MKKLLLTPVFIMALAFSSLSHADTAGVWIGGGLWNWDVSGTVRYQQTNPSNDIDVESNGSNYLNWSDDNSGTFFFIIEHPVPLVPNVKFFSTSLSTGGTGQATVQYGGTTLTGTVTSSLELDMTDVTLYYSLLDNVVGLDLGLNLKIVDGSVSITDVGTTTIETSNFKATIPMLYAGIDVALPLTGLSLGVNGAYIGYNGSALTEFHAYMRYDSDYLFGVEAGIKSFNLELDDIDQSYANLEFSGTYAQLYVHF